MVSSVFMIEQKIRKYVYCCALVAHAVVTDVHNVFAAMFATDLPNRTRTKKFERLHLEMS